MKNLVKGKIVSLEELTRLSNADDSKGITYSDIEKMFNSEDLEEYNRLCTNFTSLIGDNDNIKQWDMILDPVTGLDLISILNRIEKLRIKYKLPGTFHRIWRATLLSNDKFEYDEVSW